MKLCRSALLAPVDAPALDDLVASFATLVGDQDLSAPLGLLSDRLAWRTAYQLVTAYDLVQGSSHSSFIAQLRSGLTLS